MQEMDHYARALSPITELTTPGSFRTIGLPLEPTTSLDYASEHEQRHGSDSDSDGDDDVSLRTVVQRPERDAGIPQDHQPGSNRSGEGSDEGTTTVVPAASGIPFPPTPTKAPALDNTPTRAAPSLAFNITPPPLVPRSPGLPPPPRSANRTPIRSTATTGPAQPQLPLSSGGEAGGDASPYGPVSDEARRRYAARYSTKEQRATETGIGQGAGEADEKRVHRPVSAFGPTASDNHDANRQISLTEVPSRPSAQMVRPYSYHSGIVASAHSSSEGASQSSSGLYVTPAQSPRLGTACDTDEPVWISSPSPIPRLASRHSSSSLPLPTSRSSSRASKRRSRLALGGLPNVLLQLFGDTSQGDQYDTLGSKSSASRRVNSTKGGATESRHTPPRRRTSSAPRAPRRLSKRDRKYSLAPAPVDPGAPRTSVEVEEECPQAALRKSGTFGVQEDDPVGPRDHGDLRPAESGPIAGLGAPPLHSSEQEGDREGDGGNEAAAAPGPSVDRQRAQSSGTAITDAIDRERVLIVRNNSVEDHLYLAGGEGADDAQEELMESLRRDDIQQAPFGRSDPRDKSAMPPSTSRQQSPLAPPSELHASLRTITTLNNSSTEACASSRNPSFPPSPPVTSSRRASDHASRTRAPFDAFDQPSLPTSYADNRLPGIAYPGTPSAPARTPATAEGPPPRTEERLAEEIQSLRKAGETNAELAFLIASHLLSSHSSTLLKHAGGMRDMADEMRSMAEESMEWSRTLLRMADSSRRNPTSAPHYPSGPDHSSLPVLSTASSHPIFGDWDGQRRGSSHSATPRATATPRPVSSFSPDPTQPVTRQQFTAYARPNESPAPNGQGESGVVGGQVGQYANGSTQGYSPEQVGDWAALSSPPPALATQKRQASIPQALRKLSFPGRKRAPSASHLAPAVPVPVPPLPNISHLRPAPPPPSRTLNLAPHSHARTDSRTSSYLSPSSAHGRAASLGPAIPTPRGVVLAPNGVRKLSKARKASFVSPPQRASSHITPSDFMPPSTFPPVSPLKPDSVVERASAKTQKRRTWWGRRRSNSGA